MGSTRSDFGSDAPSMVCSMSTSPPFTDEEIDAKLAEIGLRRGLVSVEETCEKLQCSRAHYYAVLAGPPGQSRELRHVAISEKIVGTYSIDVAALLLRR